jgi:hypothetical protein
MVKRETLANELLRLEQLNADLSQTSGKLGKKLADFITELDSPKSSIVLRDAQQYEEDLDRQNSLLHTQLEALKMRRKREMLANMNDSAVKVVLGEIEDLKLETEQIRKRRIEKQERDAVAFMKLNQIRTDIFEKLVEFYNGNDRDFVVPMSDLLLYVKSEDPVIQLRNFDKMRRKNVEEEDFWMLLRRLQRDLE